MNNRPMKLLLIEDDEFECNTFKKYISEIIDADLIGITNSSEEALALVKYFSPEGIILDIELHKGQGSGLDFLYNLPKYTSNFKPIIIVTTNSASTILYDKLHSEGVDLIFYKHQKDYSAKHVVLELLSLRRSLHKYNNINIEGRTLLHETQAEFKYNTSTRINAELDLIGVGSHLKGRKYIHDAILFLIETCSDEKDTDTPFTYLSEKYKRAPSSISRVMQTAIDYAWRVSSPDDLERYYTAKINYHTGVPSPTEFIYYYCNKIRNNI